jgi:hypothetical protein
MDSLQRWLAALALRAHWRERMDSAAETLKQADLDPVAGVRTEQEIAIYEQVIHELESFLKLDEE